MAKKTSKDKAFDKEWNRKLYLYILFGIIIVFILAGFEWQPIVDYVILVRSLTQSLLGEWTEIIALIYLGVVIGLMLFALFKKRIRSKMLKLLEQVYKPNKGKEFEKELAGLFAANGYKVEMPSKGKDFGADLIIEWEGVKKVVQLKYRERNRVSLKAVQEVGSARDYYKASEGIVITNQDFTEEAKKLANANNRKLLRGVDYKGVIETQQV